MTWNNQTAGDVCAARVAGSARCERPGLVLAASILASSLAFVDGSVVNVGLPAIGRDLHGSAADLQWVINAYLLPLSAFLLLGGAVGDRFGSRDVLTAGIGVFAVGSAMCALGPSLSWLLAARVLQGTGAAFLLPNSLAVLGSAYSGAARGRAIGIWSASSAITAAIGPVLGGALIDLVGWRAIFLVNLPLAAGAIALALLFVRNPPRSGKPLPLDGWGALFATASLLALTWSLTEGAGRAGWTPPIVEFAAGGVALAGLFLWTEKRRGANAMMPLALFDSREFTGLTVLTFLVYGALGSLLVLVPFVLIRGAGYSATEAGAALLPFPVVLAVVSPMLGAVAGRIGSRIPLCVGSLVISAGFLLLLRVGARAAFLGEVLPAMLMIALGMGGVAAPLTTAVLGSVDPTHTGLASGLNSAVARSGGMVATALIGGVLAARGSPLFNAFHTAAVACAAACLAAAACGVVLLRRRGERGP
ncbi:MAG TPA: MFS transporter [Rhizomicrobium sp.]|nr:MFS transporter [Rhizomicrobium sp.]